MVMAGPKRRSKAATTYILEAGEGFPGRLRIPCPFYQDLSARATPDLPCTGPQDLLHFVFLLTILRDDCWGLGFGDDLTRKGVCAGRTQQRDVENVVDTRRSV